MFDNCEKEYEQEITEALAQKEAIKKKEKENENETTSTENVAQKKELTTADKAKAAATVATDSRTSFSALDETLIQPYSSITIDSLFYKTITIANTFWVITSTNITIYEYV